MDDCAIEKLSSSKYKLLDNTLEQIKTDLVFVIIVGDQNSITALKIKEVVDIFTHGISNKMNYLIDITKSGKVTHGARSIYKMLAEDEHTRRAGLFGLNPVARVLASFVINTYKKDNLKFFSTRDDALQWLLEE